MNVHVDSIRRAPLLLLAALAAGSASGQASRDALPIENLKAAYLACELAAVRDRLDSATAMHCSVIYEELKWRAFDGDFERLLAWSKSQAPGFRAATGSRTSAPAPATPAHSWPARAP